MRARQRSFILEIKSTKRQAKAIAPSVWGGIDLNAFVQDIEDSASSQSSSDFADDTTLANERPVNHLIEGNLNSECVSGSNTARAAIPRTENTATDSSEPTGLSLTMDEFVNSQRDYENKAIRSLVTVDDISSDAVAALEAENMRLIRLLIDRLRVENARIKKRLERFRTS